MSQAIVNQWGFREDELVDSIAIIIAIGSDRFKVVHTVTGQPLRTETFHTRASARSWLASMRNMADPMGIRFTVVGEDLLADTCPNCSGAGSYEFRQASGIVIPAICDACKGTGRL